MSKRSKEEAKTEKSVYHKVINFPTSVLRPIKDYLLDEKKRLQEKKVELVEEDPFFDEDRSTDNAASDTDVAESVGHERVSAIKVEVDKALINVRKALTRIKLGKYGTCANCGKMIDTDRLAINPTAEFCMSCEKKQEKKRGLRG